MLMTLDDLFEGFQRFPFPTDASIVYAIGICEERGFFPFYVGESARQLGRMGGSGNLGRGLFSVVTRGGSSLGRSAPM